MKVLIACEFSGIVREEFKKRGHNAWSCDLLPTEIQGQHIQDDVLPILNQEWDLMIAHPPCTYLSNVGIRYFNEDRYGDKARKRKKLRDKAFIFFMKFITAPIDKICVENPVGWPNSHYRKANQIINPYYFGDPEKKRTCLWLKGLPLLEYHLEDDLFSKRTATDIPKPKYINSRGKKIHFTEGMLKGRTMAAKAEMAKLRSKTFQGIAKAMATQWG